MMLPMWVVQVMAVAEQNGAFAVLGRAHRQWQGSEALEGYRDHGLKETGNEARRHGNLRITHSHRILAVFVPGRDVET